MEGWVRAALEEGGAAALLRVGGRKGGGGSQEHNGIQVQKKEEVTQCLSRLSPCLSV
jgi:hypothetical protein